MRNALPTIAGVITISAALSAPVLAQGPVPSPGTAQAGQPRPAVGQGDAEHKASVGDSDVEFMRHAATDGQAEIELADVALKQGQSADVKTFATKIKADHLKAASELKRVATAKHVTLSSALTAEQKDMKEKLGKLSGSAFDRAYADAMVTDHQKAVALFTSASESADSEVKAFASTTLPVLKQHLQHAEDLQKSVAGPARP
jgi:putative membrane protein